jgi:hypothetical protein
MSSRPLRVGILTFHEVFNPGAFLQAYATQMLLRRLGHNPEIIDYNPPAHRYHPIKHALELGWRLPLRPRKWLDDFIRNRAFGEARKEHLILSRRCLTREDISKTHYDAVLVGADIVWNFKMRRLGQDPVYFGEGLKTDRLIAFAPSCGPCSVEDSIPEYVSNGLPRFHHISVRDENTARIVEKVCGPKPEVICDPTFHVAEAVTRCRANGPRGEYILVYLLPGQHTSATLIAQICALRAQTGLPIHAVLYRHDWADRNTMSCDPFQWLQAMCGARYVFTNTFHGAIFSVLLRTNFVLELNDLVRSKTEDMARNMGICSRLFDEGCKLEEVLASGIDYQRALDYVDLEARRAISYLSESLV